MTTKGIIFSGPMVRALLAGTKTQTRRLLSLRGFRQFTKFGPSTTPGYDWHFRRGDGCWCDFRAADLPLPYAPGDRLYVRESWALLDRLTHNDPGTTAMIQRGFFRADNSTVDGEITRWTPSNHMPRWASRLWLEVTEVRVQCLHDIREADCIAEGCEPIDRQHSDELSNAHRIELAGTFSYRLGYKRLWNSLHTKPGQTWADNPWIVAVSFDVHHGNIDQAAN